MSTAEPVLPGDVHRTAQYGDDLWKELRSSVRLARKDNDDDAADDDDDELVMTRLSLSQTGMITTVHRSS